MQRVILITGAAGGIGAAVVERLTRRGETVIATDIAGCERTLDVTSRADWTRVVEHTIAEHGQVDVLMNIAGIARAGHFWTLEPDQIDRHMDVNVKGAALGAHTVLPFMIARASGHIINIGSLAGLAPVPGIALYSASKFALRGLSLALAMELAGTGVDVSIVHPDLVDTPMIAEQRHQPEAAYSFSGGRTLDVQEIAELLTDRVMSDRPQEIAIPRGRGAMCKLVSAFPGLARAMAPALRRKGLARQERERRTGADS